VDYDTPHRKPWGVDMVLYLFLKAVSTGAMLVAALLWLIGSRGPLVTIVAPAIAIVTIAVTAAVLVIDLERPERFFYILTRSNWRSWMVWGAWFLTAHGALSTLWLLLGWLGVPAALTVLAWPVVIVAVLATSYTGFLFAQGLGRDLWQGPHAAIHLLAQSGAAGAASLLIAALFVPPQDAASVEALTWVLGGSVAAHVLILLFDNVFAPSPTRHHELALHTIRRGPYSRLFWGVAVVGGGVLPLLLVLVTTSLPLGLEIASVLALAGSAAWEYIWVEAGQSVPLS
jgi:formate-dependent nitrite reductase membrane component NrfD